MHRHRLKMFVIVLTRTFSAIKFCQLLILANSIVSICTQPTFRPTYNEEMTIAKENILKMIKRETYQLTGFDEVDTVPVTYPIDICLMEIDQILYATCLNLETNVHRNVTMLSVFKQMILNAPTPEFVLIYAAETNSAFDLDCISMGNTGFVAIVNDMENSSYNDVAGEGSPVFQLKNDQMMPVQYFVKPRQNRVSFIKTHTMLFMHQTFRNDGTLQRQKCPILMWMDSTFNEVDYLPCTNAMQIESFMIGTQIFVAIANSMDENNNGETYSPIFQYDINTHKFNLTQNIKTYGAIDIKHFQLSDESKTSNYLIVANTFHMQPQLDSSASSNAVIYQYESGKFVPFQILNFEKDVKQFLPVSSKSNEFVLLISVDEGNAKTFQFSENKFVETPITFTGGSFGNGLSKMRTHTLKNDLTLIVVANTAMYRDATNLFRARFSLEMKTDFGKAFSMFDAWYDSVKKRLHADGITEMFNRMEAAQLPSGFNVLNLDHTNVNELRINSLKSELIPIDINLVKKSLNVADNLLSKEAIRRPKRLNESASQNGDLTRTNDTELNTEAMTTSILIIKDNLTIHKKLSVEFLNNHRIASLLRHESDLNLDSLAVDHLAFPNNLTENYQALKAKIKMSNKRVKRDSVGEDEEGDQPLIVHEVVTEMLNGLPVSYLFEKILRTNQPVQSLESEVNFATIRMKKLKIGDNRIGEISIDDIALTGANTTIIHYPVRFVQPLQVNALTVLNEFGPVAIRDGRLDALFRRTKRPQVITGQKQFESVILMEPIILQGKINISSPILNKINPIVTINEDVTIEGDYLMNGNVTINGFLKSNNIFGQSIHFSVDQLLSDGLRISDSSIDASIEFTQPIRVGNIRAPTQINDIGVESFIKRNVDDFQVIEAHKTFSNDLNIESGFCEAKMLNNIDLQTLNSTLLKRSAPNQTLTGTIQVQRIIAENVNGEVSFGSTPINRLLTKNSDQMIYGNVTIHGNAFIVSNSLLHVNHLSTRSHVIGMNLDEMLDDCYTFPSNENINITSGKYFQNISIGQLVIERNFWQVATTDVIENRLNVLSRDVNLDGILSITNRFEISDLFVTDTINGIPSAAFGREWLLLEGKQTFSVPQQFSTIVAEENIQLNGLINNYNLTRIVFNSIWRNSHQQMTLKNLAFDDVIFKKSLALGGMLNNIRVPDDVIRSDSGALQNFIEVFELEANMQINGTLSVDRSVNDINYAQTCSLTEGNDDINLDIKGDVIFTMNPTVEYLNSESYQEILSTTWLMDEHTVNFASNVVLENVVLHKPITTAGHINKNDLANINERYLSKTKPQTVSTIIYFRNRVQTFNHTLEAKSMNLKGLLKVDGSDVEMNLTHFDGNVLKSLAGTTFINGQWEVREMQFLGSLLTALNSVNLNQDVVLWNQPNTYGNIIRAEKTFKLLAVDRLTCVFGCKVQDVNVDEWITKAALSMTNATIQGYVYVESPFISQINVLGKFNNNTFQTILLKNEPQTINGNVYIGNNKPSNVLASLTFNKIFVNFVNGRNFTDFHSSLVKRDRHNDINAKIYANMQFGGPTFDNLYISQMNGANLSSANFMYPNNQIYRSASTKLEMMVTQLVNRDRNKHFEQMVVRQTFFAANIQRLQRIHHDINGRIIEFVALNSSNSVLFYTWNTTTKILNLANNDKLKLTLPDNIHITDLTVLRAETVDLLAVQLHNSTDGRRMIYFYDDMPETSYTQPIYEIQTNHTMKFTLFPHKQRNCFILHQHFVATEFSVFCVNSSRNSTEIYPLKSIPNAEKVKGIYEIGSQLDAMMWWSENDTISVRRVDFRNRNYETMDEVNMSNLTNVAVKTSHNNTYIGLCMNIADRANSNRKGVIKVYRLIEYELLHIQTMEFENEAVTQCEFSMLSRNQLILIVYKIGRSSDKLDFYQYEGINGFKLSKHMNIQLHQSIEDQPTANSHQFLVYETKHGTLRFLAIYMDKKMGFIETIYN